MSKTTKPAGECLTPVTEAELDRTEGGYMYDEYCGTRVPGWPRPLAFNAASILTNPVLVPAVKGL